MRELYDAFGRETRADEPGGSAVLQLLLPGREAHLRGRLRGIQASLRERRVVYPSPPTGGIEMARNGLAKRKVPSTLGTRNFYEYL